MKKNIWGVLGVMSLVSLLMSSVNAMPNESVLNTLNAEVFRVEVTHQNGTHGLGSAVVIAKDQMVTNCHVVMDATDVKVVVNGVAQVATGIKPDWRHDICIVTLSALNTPIAKIGQSKSLHYQAPVITVGYPDKAVNPVNTYGEVQGLFPMDGGYVIRATSAFNLGASGGGMFDESGHLVGIITLKSRGAHAQYFFMPVEWVVALMSQPAQALGVTAQKPFWALVESERPYFMKVVQPLLAHDWNALKQLSKTWVMYEPENAESWVTLARAEYETNQYEQALMHFNQALALRNDSELARAYLNKISARLSDSASLSPQKLAKASN
jgi:hypothetical protein